MIDKTQELERSLQGIPHLEVPATAAEARLETLRLLTENMAHEVRNHLSSLKLSFHMLGQEIEAGSDQQTHFAIAKEAIARIDQYLKTLECAAHAPAPILRPTSFFEVVERGIEGARPAILKKAIGVRRQFPSDPPVLPMDRVLMAQAVTQLVNNGVDAMERGGELHLVMKHQTAPEGGSWILEVRDHGAGIPPEIEPRIFEPFFSTGAHHLGLGLAIVHQVVSRHGGTVSVDSRPGEGTTVRIRLPETQPEEAACPDS